MARENLNYLEHFTALKSKYQATKCDDCSLYNPLYLILRKADLGITLGDLELQWLTENELVETINIIKQEQKYRAKEFSDLEVEFDKLKSKFKIKKPDIYWEKNNLEKNNLYFILTKLDSGMVLTDDESSWLGKNGLFDLKAFSGKIKHCIELKIKYQATQHKDSSPDSFLYHILKKIDASEKIIDSEYEWLLNHNLWKTAEIFDKQELAKEDKFAQLKDKYKATQYPEKSIYNPLYPILKKLANDQKLNDVEFKWLEQHRLTETIAIAQELEQTREFAILKIKYKATQSNDASPKSHLYKVLKRLELGEHLGEQDINFLKKRKLTETIEIVNAKYVSLLKFKIASGELLNDSEMEWLKNNGREDIIILAQQQHFRTLKKKYGLINPDLPMQPFYTIMLKLEKKERLDPLLVVQLIEQDELSRDGKIATAYYRLEAEFYEEEFHRTGEKWKIPTASGYWRKANEPERALQLTNLDLSKIKESKLKSAILVTRGAAFRDNGKLKDAENCAIKAIEYHPSSYQPYTLMGAIAYDRGNYSQGDDWFEKAIQRGAKSEDIDDEIKRLVRGTKDENKKQNVIEYLLKKDVHRYAWAKSYLKKASVSKSA